MDFDKLMEKSQINIEIKEEDMGVFPKKLIDLWIDKRRKDLQRHIEMPTPVEFDMYYDL